MRPRLRRGIWISLATLVALAAIVSLAFGPTVRARLRKQALQQGVNVSIGSVKAGWGRVWLRDLIFQIPAVPGLAVTVDAVEIDLSATLGVEAVTAHGANIVVTGTVKQLARQLRAWRLEHSGGTGAASVRYAAKGVRVTWRQAFPGAPEQHLWGGGYERQTDGVETLTADLVRAQRAGVGLELHGPRVVLTRHNQRRAIQHMAADAVFARVALEALPGLRQQAAQRPASSTPADTPAASRAAARRKSRAPPDAKPSAPLDPGPRLREQLGAMALALQASLRPGSELDLSGLRLELRHSRQLLRFGPGRLRLRRAGGKLKLSLAPEAQPQRTPLTLQLVVPLANGPVKLALQGGPVSLAALGVQEGDMGLLAVARTQLQARGELLLAADGGSVDFSGAGKLAPLALQQQWLARTPLRGISVAWEGKGKAATDGSHIRIERGQLDVGSVRFQLSGQVERGEDHWAADLQASIPLASCQAMLESIPDGMAPLLLGLKMSGTFTLAAELVFNTRRLAATELEWKMRNECRITAVPPRINPQRFRAAWTRRVLGSDGRELTTLIGPGTADWVTLEDISPYMQTAVLVCEDGHFWRHAGFDEKAIRDSIRDNLKAKDFVRGASTITMQLAKNLYLPREKTVARKLQEAVLTLLLEQELTKSEILELYLNVIEYGPGIYGVGPAARHYFSSTARELSLGQAMYLASILPNPKRHHFTAGGQVSPGWSEYLRHLMRIAFKIKRINETELEEGLAEQVTFGVPYSRVGSLQDAGNPYARDGVADGANLQPPSEQQAEPDY